MNAPFSHHDGGWGFCVPLNMASAHCKRLAYPNAVSFSLSSVFHFEESRCQNLVALAVKI